MMETKKLSMKEKIGYSLGDLAFNLVFMNLTVYLLYFYTDIFGISAAAASTLFLVARLWDAVNDPIMGALVDKTHTKWGKFRPYILFSAIPFAIMAVLTFTTPNFSYTGKLIYAYVTYIGLGMVCTIINIPYGALASAMTQEHGERGSLSAIRMLFALMGGALVVVGMPILSGILGGGNIQKGYQYTMILFAILATVLNVITFATTKERYSTPNTGTKTSFKGIVNLLKTNRPLQIICLAFLVIFGMNAIGSAMGIYYFTYYVNRPDLIPVAGALPMGVMLIVLFSVPFLLKKIDKKTMLIVGMAISLIRYIAYATGNIPIIFAGIIIGSIGSGMATGVMWGFVPDTIEYGEWKTGIRAEGMVYAIVGFFLKFGSALGGLVPGVVLTVTGYVAKAPEQTSTAMFGILSLVSIIPFVLTLLFIMVMKFYKLDKAQYNKILEELKARKEASVTSV